MKKYILFIIFLVSTLLLVTLCACVDNETDQNVFKDNNIVSPKLFSVDYVTTEGGTISGANKQTIEYGKDSEIVIAVPNTGYKFVEWSDGITAPERQEKNITTDIKVTAKFIKITYSVKYATDGNGIIDGKATQSIPYGKKSEPVTAQPNYGYKFEKWSDGVLTPQRKAEAISENITLIAYFKKQQIFTLTYAVKDSEQGYIEGETVQNLFEWDDGTVVTAIANEGYEFVGWSDGVTTERRTDLNVVGSKEIIAYFEESIFTYEYVYEYVCGIGGRLEGETIQIVQKNKFTSVITAIPDDGYVFGGWVDGLKTPTRQDKGGWYRNEVLVGNSIKIPCCFIKVIEVNYYIKNGYGGYISGLAKQQIFSKGDATAVKAVPNPGYVFVGWADGETKDTRQDKNLTENLTMTAFFEPIEKIFKYDYLGGTINADKKAVTVSRDNPKASTFVLPQKAGYEFGGWYADKDLKLRVTNADGELMLGYNTVTLNSDTLYARWISPNDDTVVYKVLVVIVDEIDAMIRTREEHTTYKHIKYKIPMVERKLCEQVADRIFGYLNMWFKGEIMFEVDTYFTTVPISDEGFKYNSDWIWARHVPELQNIVSKYDSLLTLFDMNDIDNEIKSPGVNGWGMAVCGSVYLESYMSYFNRYSGQQKDEILNYNCSSRYFWDALIGTCIHELIHTIAEQYYYNDIYYYHAVIEYYYGIYDDFEVARLYLLCEAEIDGVKVGIPKTFWTEGGTRDMD